VTAQHHAPPSNRGELRIVDVLRQHAETYRAAHRPDSAVDRVLSRIQACRTAALGGHLVHCRDCGTSSPVYNSCQDRHCPNCQGLAQAKWAEARMETMLPVAHFQVVFTLPSGLRPLARRHPRFLYDVMMRAAAETLKQLGEQRLHAQLATIAVLHTWNRSLSFHPHVHFLVSAGGLRQDGQAWVDSHPRYLFPTRILSAMFRGKVMAAIQKAHAADGIAFASGREASGKVLAGLRRPLRSKAWVVHVEPPAGRDPIGAVKYLAQYVQKIAIGNSRLVSATDESVTFKTRNGGLETLSGVEFVRRYLLHVLPKGFRKVRYYGLMASGNLAGKLETARRLLTGAATESSPPVEAVAVETEDSTSGESWETAAVRLLGWDPGVCHHCGSRNLEVMWLPPISSWSWDSS